MDPGDNIWVIYIKVSYLGPHGSTKLLARFTNSVIGGLLGGRVDRPQHAALLLRLNKYSDHKTLKILFSQMKLMCLFLVPKFNLANPVKREN